MPDNLSDEQVREAFEQYVQKLRDDYADAKAELERVKEEAKAAYETAISDAKTRVSDIRAKAKDYNIRLEPKKSRNRKPSAQPIAVAAE